MKALILFSSRDGQTQRIANYIAGTIKENYESDVLNISQTGELNWEQYDRVLIGASVRYGHFHPAVANFIKKHLTELRQRPGGFFTVNLTARKPEKCTPQTNAYMRKFLLHTPWQPDCCAVFAGALRYPRYRWFDRMMIQLIMRLTGGETDIRKEVEYTDWQQVEQFAYEFVQLTSRLL